ncbi:D-inositol-3-phosphate glycosyltransferase [subsurface metagenome]
MKILIIHNAGRSDFPSGELVVVNKEAKALRKRGVEVYCHIEKNDKSDNIFSFRTLFTGINLFWSYPSYCKIKKLIDKYNPDVVHFHSVLPLLSVSSFYACKVKGIPVVQTLHNYRWFCVEGGLYSDNSYCDECLQKGALRGIIKKCSRKSFAASTVLTINNTIYVKSGILFNLVDRFLAVSNFLRDKYIQAGFPEDKILVKYNGIELKNIIMKEIKTCGRNGITFVGRLTPAKGTKILRNIIQQVTDIPINIIGDGPDLQILRDFCKNGKHKNVKIFSRVDSKKVYDIISKSTCVIMPSLSAETFGLVAIEALACGTPVIVSKIGALPEIIEQSGGGIVVDTSDSSERFLLAIREFLKSPNKIEKMGMKGKIFVEQNFSMDKNIDNLFNIYREVLKKRS